MKKPVIQWKLLRSLGGSLGGFQMSDQFNVVLLVRTEAIVLLSTVPTDNLNIYIYIFLNKD